MKSIKFILFSMLVGASNLYGVKPETKGAFDEAFEHVKTIRQLDKVQQKKEIKDILRKNLIPALKKLEGMESFYDTQTQFSDSARSSIAQSSAEIRAAAHSFLDESEEEKTWRDIAIERRWYYLKDHKPDFNAPLPPVEVWKENSNAGMHNHWFYKSWTEKWTNN